MADETLVVSATKADTPDDPSLEELFKLFEGTFKLHPNLEEFINNPELDAPYPSHTFVGADSRVIRRG